MCEECKEFKKEIFLDELPRRGKLISWKKSIGYKIRFIYGDIEGFVEIIDYNSKEHNLYIKYLDKDPYKIHTNNFKSCSFGVLLDKITKKYRVEIGEVFTDNNRNITIIDREIREKIKPNNDIQNYRYYKYHCNICGYEDWIEEGNLFHGYNCGCCANQKIGVGINDIPTTAPWMIPYFQGGYDEAKLYAKSSHQPIYPICPDCGRVKNKPIIIKNIYDNHGIGCSCSDGQSYPFKLMFNILEQLNIEFETEYSPEWVSPKRYDFYFEINNQRYIIETDGGFHISDNKMNGQTKEESQAIDDEKDRLANEHGIEVIRINCYVSELEYIKRNILDKLSNLFNFNNIDWSKAEEFALSNLVKKACEMKRNNPEMTCSDIGKIMNLSKRTISRYLKKGSKIWDWCNYDSRSEKIKSVMKNGKITWRKVEIFKNNISLGKFESCSELERQSEKLFGVKLSQDGISATCRGRQKQHKGFTFKYID